MRDKQRRAAAMGHAPVGQLFAKSKAQQAQQPSAGFPAGQDPRRAAYVNSRPAIPCRNPPVAVRLDDPHLQQAMSPKRVVGGDVQLRSRKRPRFTGQRMGSAIANLPIPPERPAAARLQGLLL